MKVTVTKPAPAPPPVQYPFVWSSPYGLRVCYADRRSVVLTDNDVQKPGEENFTGLAYALSGKLSPAGAAAAVFAQDDVYPWIAHGNASPPEADLFLLTSATQSVCLRRNRASAYCVGDTADPSGLHKNRLTPERIRKLGLAGLVDLNACGPKFPRLEWCRGDKSVHLFTAPTKSVCIKGGSIWKAGAPGAMVGDEDVLTPAEVLELFTPKPAAEACGCEQKVKYPTILQSDITAECLSIAFDNSGTHYELSNGTKSQGGSCTCKPLPKGTIVTIEID